MSGVNPQYRFRTVWSLTQPASAVWAALDSPTTWPRWWPGCLVAEPLTENQQPPVGRRYRFHWSGALPYTLVMDVTLVALEPCRRMAGRVEGLMVGTAEWTLWREAGETKLAFELAVSARQTWAAYLAPLARPVFRWNHEHLMARGEAGLEQWLSQRQRLRSGRLQAGTG